MCCLFCRDGAGGTSEKKLPFQITSRVRWHRAAAVEVSQRDNIAWECRSICKVLGAGRAVSIETGPWAGDTRNQGSVSSGEETFLFSGAHPLHTGGKVVSVKLTAVLYLVLRLRICGAIPPFSHTSSWHGA
jgi:hypothetical protein